MGGRGQVRKYGFWNFVLDVFMISLTAGFWLVWIFIREARIHGGR